MGPAPPASAPGLSTGPLTLQQTRTHGCAGTSGPGGLRNHRWPPSPLPSKLAEKQDLNPGQANSLRRLCSRTSANQKPPRQAEAGGRNAGSSRALSPEPRLPLTRLLWAGWVSSSHGETGGCSVAVGNGEFPEGFERGRPRAPRGTNLLDPTALMPTEPPHPHSLLPSEPSVPWAQINKFQVEQLLRIPIPGISGLKND